MNLRIREANSNNYTEVYKIIIEVHKLHFKNRPDVYLDSFCIKSKVKRSGIGDYYLIT